MKPKIAIVRGKFLNRYEMQFFEPLIADFDLTGFGSLSPYHDKFVFPVIKFPSPMDLPDFPYKMPLLNRIFIDAHYLLGLEDKLKDYDLVHTAETYFHYTQQCLNAKKRGYVKKVIATILENIPFNNEGIRGRREFKDRARSELDHIIALTQKTKNALLAEGCDEKKITIIGHFVDTMRFMPEDDWFKKIGDKTKKDFRILFVGRLENYKGVFDVLSAAERLLKDVDLRGIALEFIFVGEGSHKEAILLKAKDMGIDKFIELNSVTYDQMPGKYEKADIFIAPSKAEIRNGAITWEEQYNTALLESQASGLPIVTTKSGGIPENIGDAGLLCQPGSTDEITLSIKKFILNADLRVRYAKKARERAVKVHDKMIGARKLKDVYQKVLAQ